MKSKIAIVIVAVVAIAIVAAFLATNGDDDDQRNDQREDSITVVDAAGREVSVALPVEKVAILEPTAIEVFAGAVGDGWEDHIALLSKDIMTREASKWAILIEKYPSLKSVPLTGDLYSTGTIPSEDVISSGATLALVSGSTAAYISGIEDQIESLERAGVSVIYIEFYDKSFTDGIAQKNYGVIGEIMGTTDVSDKIVSFYDEKVKHVKDVLAANSDKAKGFTFSMEMPMDDGSYGNFVSMGTPEMILLGGTNICTAPGGADFNWSLEKMQAPDGDGPDFIFLVNTGYYGSKAIMGHGVEPSAADCEKVISVCKARDGWSDLAAVKNGNIALIYGELRNSAFGLVDLYNAASIIYPELFGQDDVDDVVAQLNELTPFGFSGTWVYKTSEGA